MEFTAFRHEFSVFVRHAPHWQLKEISKELRETTKRRFIGGRAKKCELVERCFSDCEFSQFMDAVDDEEDKRCYMLMAVLGLRIGELTALRGRDLEGDQLRITGCKGGYSAVVRLPAPLLSLFPACGPDEKPFKRSPKALREHFRGYRHLAGLDDIYLYTEPCGSHGTRNPRYRISLHSLRHYAIKRFYQACKDPDLTRKFARHKHGQTTEEYLKSTRKEEMEMVLEGICRPKTIKALEMKRV